MNTQIEKDGSLVIRVKPDPSPVRSRSGKTVILASTRGALTLEDGSKLNLNWYKYP